MAFDLFILKRPGAEQEYSEAERAAAKARYERMDAAEIELITRNMIAGLPGSEESFTLEQFQHELDRYKGVTAEVLQREPDRLPAGGGAGGRRGGFGAGDPSGRSAVLDSRLPRILSTEDDFPETGRGGSQCLERALPLHGVVRRLGEERPAGMMRRWGDRVNFVHLRSTQRDAEGTSSRRTTSKATCRCTR